MFTDVSNIMDKSNETGKVHLFEYSRFHKSFEQFCQFVDVAKFNEKNDNCGVSTGKWRIWGLLRLCKCEVVQEADIFPPTNLHFTYVFLLNPLLLRSRSKGLSLFQDSGYCYQLNDGWQTFSLRTLGSVLL